MRTKTRLAILAVVAVLGSVLVATQAPTDRAEAITNADFNPGYIISDARFFDGASMSELQIQQFLNSRVPNCIAANGVPCLKSYTETTFSRGSAGYGRCAGYDAGTSESAARIIAKVSAACNISSQVLLVLLQKERGIVTKSSPTAADYKVATGYGCPDTSACDTRYYGFYNQVYLAAAQFRQYTYNPNGYTYRVGINNILYHPNTACGRPATQILNQATANLYNYTPYQPNAAAMANLRGTGDACSSYGNRNFWVYFNDWFGSPTGPISPIGNVDAVSPVPGGLRVTGWVLDPSTADPVTVHSYFNGAFSVGAIASNSRPDVANAYPGYGDAHGFDFVIPTTVAGTACIYGINVGPGQNSLIRCIPGTPRTGNPAGYLDSVTASQGTVSFSGWSVDPDTAGPVEIHVYVAGRVVGFSADQPRPDLAASWSGYGINHGFGGTISVPVGQQTLCAYAINQGGGSVNPQLGCRTVSVPGAPGDMGRAPIGSFDSVSASGSMVTVAGWTFDPDTAASNRIQVLVDGVLVAEAVANLERTDVAAAYPGYGSAHGFMVSGAAPPGTRQVCLTALNTGSGSHTSLGCKTVTVPAGLTELGRAAIGFVDAVQKTATGFTVSGWAIDPDTAAPVNVIVLVDLTETLFVANGTRDDLVAVYPQHGPQHGFVSSVTAGPGTHNVCAYALDSVSSARTLLSCTLIPG